MGPTNLLLRVLYVGPLFSETAKFARTRTASTSAARDTSHDSSRRNPGFGG